MQDEAAPLKQPAFALTDELVVVTAEQLPHFAVRLQLEQLDQAGVRASVVRVLQGDQRRRDLLKQHARLAGARGQGFLDSLETFVAKAEIRTRGLPQRVLAEGLAHGREVAAEMRHLALVVAIEDEGGLNAAARRLALTPSALSQQLRELETRLGGALFQRAWRSLIPTPAGRRFTDGARATLRELQRLEAETRELLSGKSATIRVATVCQQSYRWLPALLEVFVAQRPEIEVSVVVDAAAAPTEWLLSRKLDVALVAGEIAKDRRVRIEPLFRDELVAVVGRSHAWFGRKRVDPAAFAHEHLFADDGTLRTSAPLGRALARAGVAPRKLTCVPMTASIAVDMTRAGLGITLLPRWTFGALDDPLLAAVRVGSSGLWLDWSVATRKEPVAAPLAAFLELLRERYPTRSRRSHKRI